MADLQDNIVAYEAVRSEMEARYFGKWVVFYDEEFIDTYPTFQEAAQDAVKRFGRGPYLIRHVGAAPPSLPASVLYHPVCASD